MLPAAPASVSGAQPTQIQSAQKAAQSQSPETARASAGEAAAANVRSETADAVKAPEQARVVARLRDGETAERTEREKSDRPAGPQPAFEESPLERQARVALDPQDPSEEPETTPPQTGSADTQPTIPGDPDPEQAIAVADIEAPPTPSDRAEASFAETIEINTPRNPAQVDLAR